MNGRRWALSLFVVLGAGCSSDGSSSGGTSASSTGGAAGSAGRTSSNAAGMSSGSAGASSGSAGASSGSAGIAGWLNTRIDLGTVGVGPVACGVPAGSCPVGSVCCERITGAAATCEGSFAACDGKPLGCDDPSDCPGQMCCAQNPGLGLGLHNGSGCKVECDRSIDRRVCSTVADCGTYGTGLCNSNGSVFKICY